MFNSLRSGNGAMVFMTATMAVIIATTSPASAWGFDWFAPVSNWLFGTAEETVLTDYSAGTTSGSYLEDAMTLVEQRYTLRKQGNEAKIFLADAVKEFRSNGANEVDVSIFLDELDYEFEFRTYENDNGLILTSATAGYALCAGPQAVPCGAAVSVVVIAQLWLFSSQGQKAVNATKSWITSHMSSNNMATQDADSVEAADWKAPSSVVNEWGVPNYPSGTGGPGSSFCAKVRRYCDSYCSYLALQIEMKFTPSGAGSRQDHFNHCTNRCQSFFNCRL
ncbi:MAG: hypothetical protein L3J67_08035 [Hyphomicrobiaceae bacterium]|nr:hypothetical protein [Hyphomicrobiaceae bacterium]